MSGAVGHAHRATREGPSFDDRTSPSLTVQPCTPDAYRAFFAAAFLAGLFFRFAQYAFIRRLTMLRSDALMERRPRFRPVALRPVTALPFSAAGGRPRRRV